MTLRDVTLYSQLAVSGFAREWRETPRVPLTMMRSTQKRKYHQATKACHRLWQSLLNFSDQRAHRPPDTFVQWRFLLLCVVLWWLLFFSFILGSKPPSHAAGLISWPSGPEKTSMAAPGVTCVVACGRSCPRQWGAVPAGLAGPGFL